jgi:hypothetical protein
LKLRAHFQLHQDVPALNLIGPRALDHPIMPFRSCPRHAITDQCFGTDPS